MAEYVIEAVAREGQGRKYAKKMRAAGKLPGVVYGPAFKPLSLELVTRSMELLYRDTLGKNALMKMKINNGGKVTEETVMFKDVLRDPVKSTMLHIDFYHVDPAHEINLDVPVVLDGVAVGVKEGGILEHGIRNIHLKCLPSKIPAAIHVDITDLKVDGNILVQDIKAPEGVIFLTDQHAVLAHIAEIKEEVVVAPEEVAAPAPGAKAGAAAAPAKAGDAKAGDAKPDAKK